MTGVERAFPRRASFIRSGRPYLSNPPDPLQKISLRHLNFKCLTPSGEELKIEPSSKRCIWPGYDTEILGFAYIPAYPTLADGEVCVISELEFPIKVGLRSDNKGIDFIVPKNGMASIRAPNGKYDIYFQYAADPESLYQGESINVTTHGTIEIKVARAGAGGSKIRKIKQASSNRKVEPRLMQEKHLWKVVWGQERAAAD